jgi:hypothetical protein
VKYLTKITEAGMARKKKPRMGRPPRHEGERLSKMRTFRIRPHLDELLQTAATKAGRSVSEEIEYRLDRSFYEDALPTRMGEIMRPWIDEAVRAATENRPSHVLWQVLEAMRPETEAGLERRLLELRGTLPRIQDEEIKRAFMIEIRTINHELAGLREARSSLTPTDTVPHLEERLFELRERQNELADALANESNPNWKESTEIEFKLRVLREASAKEPEKPSGLLWPVQQSEAPEKK